MQKINANLIGFDGFPAASAAATAFLSSHAEYDHQRYSVFPGFCDVHVHFREPGFSYKETMASGSAAAAHGGYTAVCTMPNLSPVPDTAEHLRVQTELIARTDGIHIYPYGAITMGQKGEMLSDMEALSSDTIAFSDDGRGVQSRDLMRAAMLKAKALGKIIVAHCEENALLHGGYIHDGEYARAHGHRGICSESEWRPIARDIALVRETGCAYHVCHISCKESVELIRTAKAEGLNVTCETAPHYLLMDETMLCEDGAYKMNPPLRTPEDREALLRGVADGTIDMIATDHAPHSAEEKARGLADSAFGIVGLETAFPLLYTHLVRPGILSIERLIDLMATRPRARFGIPIGADFTVWDTERQYRIRAEELLSMGRATPFVGWEVCGECALTVCEGKPIYQR